MCIRDSQKDDGDDCYCDDPGHSRLSVGNLDDSTDAENRSIENHSEQKNADHLYLLNIIGASGDQRSSGKTVCFPT